MEHDGKRDAMKKVERHNTDMIEGMLYSILRIGESDMCDHNKAEAISMLGEVFKIKHGISGD